MHAAVDKISVLGGMTAHKAFCSVLCKGRFTRLCGRLFSLAKVKAALLSPSMRFNPDRSLWKPQKESQTASAELSSGKQSESGISALSQRENGLLRPVPFVDLQQLTERLHVQLSLVPAFLAGYELKGHCPFSTPGPQLIPRCLLPFCPSFVALRLPIWVSQILNALRDGLVPV